MIKYLLVLTALVSSGCAAGMWYHPTADEAQFNMDSAQCEMVARQQLTQAPKAYSTPRQTYSTPPSYNTECRVIGNTMYCDSSPSQSQQSYQELNRILQERERQGYDMGRNIGDGLASGLQIGNYIGTCLRAKGYVWR